MERRPDFAKGLSIGIIMDGNGRWAKKRGLPRTAGHKKGAEVFKDITRYCNELEVASVTFYAFSTENFLGDRSPLSEKFKAQMEEIETKTAHNTGTTLNVAINYGGRQEIVRAAQILARRVQQGTLKPEEINEQLMSDCMYTTGQKDPDFILRPSGEHRLSNFMLWQASYAEFVDMDVLWPDFTRADLDRAIDEFNHRSRRFGGV